MRCDKSCILLVTTVALARGIVDAHSWIDCFMNEADFKTFREDSWGSKLILGGDYVAKHDYCSGFGRNYPTRASLDINENYSCKIDQTLFHGDQPICCNKGGVDQTTRENAYTGSIKMLKAQPGEFIHFAYMPNGHVSKDKMGRDTPMHIYWSGTPNGKLETVSDLTPEKDISGMLNFDDGECGETCSTPGQEEPCTNWSGRRGNFKPCVQRFRIPESAAVGEVYSMTWVWDFRQSEKKNIVVGGSMGYYGSYYTTCFDVEIVASDSAFMHKVSNEREPTFFPSPDSPPIQKASNFVASSVSPPIEPIPTDGISARRSLAANCDDRYAKKASMSQNVQSTAALVTSTTPCTRIHDAPNGDEELYEETSIAVDDDARDFQAAADEDSSLPLSHQLGIGLVIVFGIGLVFVAAFTVYVRKNREKKTVDGFKFLRDMV